MTSAQAAGKKTKDDVYLIRTQIVISSDWTKRSLSQPGDFSERTGMSGGKSMKLALKLNKLQHFSQVAFPDSGLCTTDDLFTIDF